MTCPVAGPKSGPATGLIREQIEKGNSTMRTTMKTGWGWMMLAMLVGAGTARGEDAAPAVTASTDLSVLSGYVWRGQVLNNQAVFQPSFTVGKNGFSLNTWGNANLTDVGTGSSPELNELDLTLGYAKTVGNVGLGVGYIEYSFPNTTVSGTREVYASIGLPNLPIVPTLSVNYDVDAADGAYGNFGLAYSHGISDKVTLGLSAGIGAATSGYNSFYFGVDKNAINDVTAGASLGIALTKSLTITPAIQYSALPDSKIKDGAAGLYKDTEAVVGSIKVSYVF